MSTMLYSAELWPQSVMQKTKLEAAHHKFHRRILGISWKYKRSDMKKSREKTSLQKLELIIKVRRLRCFGTSCGWTMADCRSKSCIGRLISQNESPVDQERTGLMP